jgi:hypothetical protein
LKGGLQSELKSTGKRCAATAREGLELSLGANERAGGWELELRTFVSETDHANVVTPGIGIFEQQLHRTLGFGESLKCCRARCVDTKDDATLTLLRKALNMKIFTADV